MQEKTAVVYTSRTGTTKQYAEWIAHDCSAKLFKLDETVIDDLTGYKTIIFGGCVYNGLIDGISFLKNNRNLLKNSRLIVFTVGLTQPGDEASYQQVLDRNFEPEDREGIRFFPLLGALDFKKMSLMQRMMMRLLKKSIQRKPKETRSQLECYILEAYGGQVDFSSRTYIQPLVQAALSGNGSEVREGG